MKNVNLCLIDGEISGKVKCTTRCWTGLLYKIPRAELDKIDDELKEYLNHAGIYFLLGENSDGKPIVYVGQANRRLDGTATFSRVIEHKRNTRESYYDEWTEVIFLVEDPDTLDGTGLTFLENYFTEQARAAKRYIVENTQPTRPGNVTRELEHDYVEFAETAKTLIGALGHKLFLPLVNNSIEEQVSVPIFHNAMQVGTLSAEAIMTNEGFVLLAGSKIAKTISNRISKSIALRKQLYLEKISNNDYKTEEDLLFTSPSAAAMFVTGASRSGNQFWKTDDGKSPDEI